MNTRCVVQKRRIFRRWQSKFYIFIMTFCVVFQLSASLDFAKTVTGAPFPSSVNSGETTSHAISPCTSDKHISSMIITGRPLFCWERKEQWASFPSSLLVQDEIDIESKPMHLRFGNSCRRKSPREGENPGLSFQYLSSPLYFS